ncbi:30S ribosomal protein S19e [Methermicoccus shengliensis]|uniref:Small ribosomal subunit protein eS19 n=1 Tax=Methermicoccus shengliensis TaxID=660064 RepID=A0A832RVJ5_9EURY|nr:30S ribosomal protein S19e [Methermicoccus shengliensis]KUK04236.1 MAG: 30S ribosomal protein S19e [Euryarchaeota archaeon 55_53]KUK29877.1 MAG: 30S ribosomal protein S19e [Methanosarcinales archeaon 56_1174]MDI3488273.1 small subunit ribosomal protein S19e [Methanosarcinales archaeon]MDN5295810.1 small subunit ribosomal protein S19e [Methanosarcinales archaeon]HIH69264.1 30S ribosomal protein S19e [Methermicoccus shengliensis]
MVTVYDVPAGKLIEALAKKLKEGEFGEAGYRIEPPEWAAYVKTGVHREFSPHDPDWWYVRCASLLRRLYVDGQVGVSRLRTYYGGRHRRGVRPPKFAKGSGSVIRHALQQLEAAGLVVSTERGRAISPKGRSLLDNVAYEVMQEILVERSELKRYC